MFSDPPPTLQGELALAIALRPPNGCGRWLGFWELKMGGRFTGGFTFALAVACGL